MSDFDHFFAKKLREEQPFPRREENWHALEGRLTAFETILRPVRPVRMRIWQVAATISLLITGWTAWALHTEKQENALLRQQAVHIRKQNADIRATLAASEDKWRKKPDFSSESGISAAGIVPAEASHGITSRRTGYSNELAGREGANSLTARLENAVETFPILPAADSVRIEGEDIAAKQPDPLPTLRSLEPASPVSSTAQASHPDFPAVKIPAPEIIRPSRPASHFLAGINGIIGITQPREKGVSMLKGQGISVEYALGKHLWLSASADWLQFDVSTDRYLTKIHHHHHDPNDPPPGGQTPPKLIKVESTQRQQQYGLGLRYVLPVRFWLQPSVRAAYTWVRVSPELISFQFEKPFPNNNPEYKSKKTDAEYLDNVWRFGAGLEHETPRWVFGIWADFSKNFAGSDSGFDALLFRTGIQYRID